MKIYLAARYSRNAEMRGYRDELVAHGHAVTSSWIDQHGGDVLESIVQERLNSEPEQCSKYAEIDVKDLTESDLVISFTSTDGGGKGGRHIEFGLALGLSKPMIVVGPRENIFHTLPAISVFPNWESALITLNRISARSGGLIQ